MPRNPFAVLGLPLDASTETIKAAWRRLAREHHPDVASGEHDGDNHAERQANQTMAEINAAYHELRDPEKRRVHRAAAAREARARGETGAARTAADADRAERGEREAAARRRDGRGSGYGNGNGHDGAEWDDFDAARPVYGGSPPARPVTARIDTSALFRPRNTVLHPSEKSPLPGLRPRPRSSDLREPPRASTPTGPTITRRGPNLDRELPNLATALDTPLRFGKFAGLTLGDVAELEPTYIDWIVRTIDRDPEITLAARVVLRDLERSGILRRPPLDSANPSG